LHEKIAKDGWSVIAASQTMSAPPALDLDGRCAKTGRQWRV